MNMIKIELNFATFEQAAEALARLNGAATPPQPIEVKATVTKGKPVTEALAAYVEQAKQEPKADDAAELAKLSAVKAEAPKEPEAVSTPTPSESAAPGVTYDELKSSIMKLVAINPNHMRAVCEQFGVKTFQGTDAVTWGKAKAVIDAKVAELKVSA